MERTFIHDFEPIGIDGVPGSSVELRVEQIEDAGLREVIQTPGAPFGSWSILDALLEPPAESTRFVFRRPLGEAREVKVALSGLFGRFVARAYLERYFNLRIFAHLGRSTVVLDGRRSIELVRRERGDLPDWVACTPDLSDLTVAEAKGSHDASGPGEALGRAWRQTGRLDVREAGQRLTRKRLAIVTRWGVSGYRPQEAWISVRDPVEKGDRIEAGDGSAVVGLFRHHVAGMLGPLGHEKLASSLRNLASADNEMAEKREREHIESLLDDVDEIPVEGSRETKGLVGGVVTRSGPVVEVDMSQADCEALARLDLRPVFVGMEQEVVRAAATGDPLAIRRTLKEKAAVGGVARRGDRASGWVCPLGGKVGKDWQV